MNRFGLKFLAALIGTGLVIVPFLNLDGLPRDLRRQIDAERSAVAAAQKQLPAVQDEVLGDLRSEPDLFRGVPGSAGWPEELSKAVGDLNFAAHDMEQLTAIEKQNRRADRAKAASLLAQQRSLRTAAMNEAAGIQKEAAHWVDFKKNLPEQLAQMQRDYDAVRNFDLSSVSADVRKAAADWPDKQADLDARLAKFDEEEKAGEAAWQGSEQARRAAAAGDLAHVDFATLVSAASRLHDDASGLPQQAQELKSLAGQLYNSWDKLLVDMESRHDEYRDKIRTVTTRFADASAKSGEVNSDEQWVPVSKDVYEARRNNLGMDIEHKPAGKYDVEADRVAQPPGFAYMAPPAQGSNQYGYWDHRDGRDFWVFYGQYALLRDLLFNHQYIPLPRGDWEEYRDYRTRGQTYYGRDTAAGNSAPKYGTQGTATQERYSGSTFAKGGGFKDSKYASRSGSYGGSKYATPGGDSTPKRFGGGGGHEEPRAAPRTYRPPAPRPSFRPPSAPRRFGRR